MKVKLSDLLEGMEFQNDQNEAWLNVKTGKIVLLSEDVTSASEGEELDPAD